MIPETIMSLQHSESVVAQMAATVFVGLAQQQGLNATNQTALVEQAVEIAIQLAERTEKRVKSDEEWAARRDALIAGRPR
jgi:phosphate/sulfate permease